MIGRVLLLFGFEWRKLMARRLPLLAFGVVVAVALLAPWAGEVAGTATSLMQGRSGGSAADGYKIGWTALSGALSAARLFLVIVLLVLAGSTVAEELSQGTLQALLMRPLRRVEVLIGKALATWSYAVVLLLVAVAAAALGAELTKGLYDVVDPNYPDRTVHAFGDMWGYVYVAVGLTLTPLAALTALGLLCSVLFEHPGHATGAAIGALLLLSALSGLSETSKQLLFVSYLSFPFEVLHDLAEQYTGVKRKLGPVYVARAILVPAVWGLAMFGLSAWLLQRRDVSRGD